MSQRRTKWWVAICPVPAANLGKAWTTIAHTPTGPRFQTHWHTRPENGLRGDPPCEGSGQPVPKDAERMVI